MLILNEIILSTSRQVYENIIALATFLWYFCTVNFVFLLVCIRNLERFSRARVISDIFQFLVRVIRRSFYKVVLDGVITLNPVLTMCCFSRKNFLFDFFSYRALISQSPENVRLRVIHRWFYKFVLDDVIVPINPVLKMSCFRRSMPSVICFL